MSSMTGLVAEYLSLVPHDRKFVSISTGDLITNSIKWRPEFSLAKAANAFRAVEQYAANLINQPWRQEFWKIRQYSGFYKHSVETALSGADTSQGLLNTRIGGRFRDWTGLTGLVSVSTPHFTSIREI